MSHPWLQRSTMLFVFVSAVCSLIGDPVRAGGLDSDGDGVPDGADLCPGTVIPESIPERGLHHIHFALMDADQVFETRTPADDIVPSEYTTATTAGCSCEQIVDALGLGHGHEKYGCSPGVMEDWVENHASSLIFADDFESGDTSAWSPI